MTRRMSHEAGPSVLPQMTEPDQVEEALEKFYFSGRVIPNRWDISHRKGVNTLVWRSLVRSEMVLSPG